MTLPISTKGGPRERPWTREHDATLMKLKQAGLTVEVIGERLRRTPAAVSSRVYNLTAEETQVHAARDFLAERIDRYLARIAKLNRLTVPDMTREYYGWR
ncbi:hypothetical protein ACIPPQ_20240 [Sphingopyxis sp. LARHCG72]